MTNLETLVNLMEQRAAAELEFAADEKIAAKKAKQFQKDCGMITAPAKNKYYKVYTEALYTITYYFNTKKAALAYMKDNYNKLNECEFTAIFLLSIIEIDEDGADESGIITKYDIANL
jgi:hypothetical protein